MINYGHGLVGYILTWISLVHVLLAAVISLAIFTNIIYEQIDRRLKQAEKITLMLSAQIYFFIFIYAITLSATNIQTLIGDVYGTNFDSSWCKFKGYCIVVMIYSIYHTFVVQGLFRLGRIVYPKYRQLQSYWIFAISASIQVMWSSALLGVILIRHDQVYLPNEKFCSVLLTNIGGMFWLMFGAYSMPNICLSIIYIRIIVFLRSQSNNLTQILKRRQQRDLVATRRIFINVGILISAGVPEVVVWIMSLSSGVEYPLSHRIIWMGANMSAAVLSIEMIVMTPQLKNLFMRRWYSNRVTPIEGSVQMRSIRTAQRTIHS